MILIINNTLFNNFKNCLSCSSSKYIGIILKRKKQLHIKIDAEIQNSGSLVILISETLFNFKLIQYNE